MSKIFLYLLFSHFPKDSSKMAIYNESKHGYYLLIPKDRKLLISSDYPNNQETFILFQFYKDKNSGSKRKVDFKYDFNSDTVYIKPRGYKYISFIGVRRDHSDSIPIQHLFHYRLISKKVKLIKKGNFKYRPLKTCRNVSLDYRRIIFNIHQE